MCNIIRIFQTCAISLEYFIQGAISLEYFSYNIALFLCTYLLPMVGLLLSYLQVNISTSLAKVFVNISLWLCHPSYEYRSLAFHFHHLSYIFMYIWTCYIFKWIYPYQYININMNMMTERQNEKVTMVVIFRWESTFGKATGRHSVSCNKFI